MANVKLEHVRKAFPVAGKTRVAVDDVTLDIPDGEFCVLVGPSGCGKSTTLRIIAGLETLTSGTVAIGGTDVTSLAPRDRDIAMVFQSYALYPHMTAYENMGFALKLRKMPRQDIDARVRQAAELLGITELLDRKPKQLSGGERQRIALGRAIVRQPKAFLFDEPLSNLDAKLRLQMRREIAALHRRLGATMIYVTHDQVEAMTLGDRIVVLDKGKVQQIAAPMKLYEQPSNTFVAGFIGSPAMNLVPGEIVREGGLRFQPAGGGWNLEIPGAGANALPETPRRAVILGIRPEDLHVAEGERNGIVGLVELAELLGNELLLHVKAGTHAMTVRSEARTPPQPGSSVRLQANPAKLHWFDLESKLRLENGD
ncbi:MAG: sn-glycerol-3-phosphate ABC transporter ATP-binding protein UgpC [Gemmatimonadota bacterium]